VDGVAAVHDDDHDDDDDHDHAGASWGARPGMVSQCRDTT
jgi:hypothetical protein